MASKPWALKAAWIVFATGVSCSALAQGTHASRAAKGDPEAGAELYQRHCVMCHSSEAGVKIVGPSLHGEMKGPSGKTAAQVREQTLVGKGLMPSFRNKLDDHQIDDLIAYIRKL